MAAPPRKVLVCSCEDTMTAEAETIGKGCRGASLTIARHLCRSQIHRFQAALKDEAPLTVACTQESALFDEVAEEAGRESPITYVNIRETAGWSREGAEASPKMAALLAAAAEPMPTVP